MTEGERASFNSALDKANKLESLLRVWNLVQRKVDVLGAQDAIPLLRAIEQLVKGHK